MKTIQRLNQWRFSAASRLTKTKPVRVIVIICAQDFGGNVDKQIERIHYVNSPFVARFIRFHPVDWHRRISMRAGLFGCPYTGNPICLSVKPATHVYRLYDVTDGSCVAGLMGSSAFRLTHNVVVLCLLFLYICESETSPREGRVGIAEQFPATKDFLLKTGKRLF